MYFIGLQNLLNLQVTNLTSQLQSDNTIVQITVKLANELMPTSPLCIGMNNNLLRQ